MSRYVVLKARQMMWMLAALLLCAIQCRYGAYGFNHQFRHKPRLCNFPVLSPTSQYGLKKNSPQRFGGEHKGNFEMLNNPSRSFGYGYVLWLDTRSVMQFALPICAAVPGDKNSNGNLKPETNVSSAGIKNVDKNDVPKVSYGESAKRSLAKAMLWRVVAAIITLTSGLVYSKSITTALSLVGSDFLSKAGFMFVGERLWSKVQWGQGKSGDSSQRSLAKALLWRAIAASNTLIMGTILSKNVSIAAKIAGTDTLFKTALFFVNERTWARIEWGKVYDVEYNL